MEDFLSRTYYGNTVLDWAIAFAIIIAAFLVGKVVYWLSSTVFRQLTKRTKTNLDDIILDMVEEPLVFALTVAGIWYGLRTLELPEAAHVWIGNVFQFLVVLAVAWMVTRLLDAVYREYLVPIAEKSENDLDDQLMPILQKGTKLAVWSIGIIVALNNAGYDVGALIAGLGIGGLALAMAAKDTVSNIFGGFTIFSDRPFKLHDRVKVAGFDGTVIDIGVRSTRLKTLEGPSRHHTQLDVRGFGGRERQPRAVAEGRFEPRLDLRHHAGADATSDDDSEGPRGGQRSAGGERFHRFQRVWRFRDEHHLHLLHQETG